MGNLLSSYGWWILALVLIAAELLAPGYFLLWIGVAAAVMGLVMLVVPGLPFIAQAAAFGVLAIATCLVYWKFIRPLAELRDDEPLLNRKGERMLGRRLLVAEAFVNGRGKVRVGDSVWLAEGPDVGVGDAVEVVAVHGATLRVTPVA
ncbi:MAG: NfeD family protein [Xanthomonadales bacterium]|nr:NfeD family protein [Xanthomonadales bacterium]